MKATHPSLDAGKQRTSFPPTFSNSLFHRIALSALLSVFLVSTGRAGVYYVDIGTGNNGNAGTSIAAAWKHLPGTVGQSGSGWVALQNGDVVYVKGGTTNSVQVKFSSSYYNGNAGFDSVQVVSGHLASSPWGSGRAIFDEANTRTFGFWIAGGGVCNGLTIDGFEVRNIAPGGVGSGFDPDNGSCCIAVGGNYRATYTRIRRCYLHDALRNADDRGHGIETDGSSGSANLVIEYNQVGPNIGTKGIEIQTYDYGMIRANYVTGTGDHGIVITGNRWDVRDNIVKMTPPYVHEPVFAIKVNNSYNDFWNNLLYQPVQTAVGSAANNMQGFGTLNNASNNRFFHNTVINCADLNYNRTSAGISFADEGAPQTGNTVQNCIIAFSTNNCGSGSWNTMQVYLNAAAVNCSVKYCDLWSRATTDSVVTFSTGPIFYTVASALASSVIGVGNVFANLVQSNPQFTGGSLPSGLDSNFYPNTTYFVLTTNTPNSIKTSGNSALFGTSANGYSSASNKFATDIVGVPRTAWSMGAYEYGGGGALPPGSPRNVRTVAVQ